VEREGLFRDLASERVIAMSAGIEPVPANALTAEVVKEVGIDISVQHSKDVSGILKEHFVFVIGVLDTTKEGCPVFPFAHKHLRQAKHVSNCMWRSGERRACLGRALSDSNNSIR
jgi:protein-tyrosine-phosphatase